MQCKHCGSNLEGELKYLAYYANGKAVYHRSCDKCTKEKYIEYKKSVGYKSSPTEN